MSKNIFVLEALPALFVPPADIYVACVTDLYTVDGFAFFRLHKEG